MSRRAHGKFRKLHKGMRKWARKDNRDLEIEAIRQGWKYILDGEVIATTHTNARELNKAFLRDLGNHIPQQYLAALALLEPDYEATNDNNLNTNLQVATAGELVFHEGRNCLVTKVATVNSGMECYHEEWGDSPYLLRCISGQLMCDECDGEGSIPDEYEICMECEGNTTTSECPACSGVGKWKEYKVVEIQPVDETIRYRIKMNPSSNVFSANRTWWTGYQGTNK